MLDMMMNDAEFMKFQDEIMADFEQEMEAELEQVRTKRGGSFVVTICSISTCIFLFPFAGLLQGGRLRSTSFAGGKRPPRRVSSEEPETCQDSNLDARVKYLQGMNAV